PLPEAACLDDCTNEDAREEFKALAAQADQVFAIPVADGLSESQIQHHGVERSLQYEAAGIYIARHCHVLVALLNSRNSPNPEIGGTAQIVHYRLTGRLPRPDDLPVHLQDVSAADRAQSPHDPSDCGPVYQIITRRKNMKGATLDVLKDGSSQGAIRKHFPQDDEIQAGGAAGESSAQTERGYEQVFRHIEEYNRDLLARLPLVSVKLHKTESSLVGDQVNPLPRALLPPALRILEEHFIQADTLALHYQKLIRTTFKVLCYLVMGGALSFTLFSKHILHHPLVLLMYPMLLAAAYLYCPPEAVSHWLQRFLKQQPEKLSSFARSLDYRALAEGLRVQFYWEYAGLKDCVADHYIVKHKGELEWIREALRACWLLADSCGEPRASTQDDLKVVERYWVEGQEGYFSSNGPRMLALLRSGSSKCHAAITAGMLGATGLVIALFLWPDLGELLIPGTHVALLNAVLATVELVGIGAAFGLGYLEKMAYAEHAKQYKRMALLFRRARRALTAFSVSQNRAKELEVLREIGREALLENGDWLLLHRERPPEPKPG
ncbi:MAG: hypothetical protein ABSE73_06035, partial [Planctomycetota bacterium]